MATFMQRMGLKPMQKPIQIEVIDDELRAGLWSTLQAYLWDHWAKTDRYGRSRTDEAVQLEALIRMIWFSHFKWPLDTIPEFRDDYGTDVYKTLREVVISGPWAEAYELLDFIVQSLPDVWADKLCAALNFVLERENAGYRFVNRQLVPVTAPTEIEAIETAIEQGTRSVKEHLAAALAKLSDRRSPDYRNSIKESISAVEAACQAVAGMPNATLGDCLKKIKSVKQLHPAFEGALIKLYGYSSDASGIRHALTEDSTAVTHADAKFMLVSCSAFTNYLWEIAAEQGIAIKQVRA